MTSRKLQLGLVVLVIALIGFIGVRSLGINIPLITGKATEEPGFNKTRVEQNCKTACQARVLSGFEKIDREGNCYCKMKNLIPTQTRVTGRNGELKTVNVTVVVDKEVNIGKINKVNITLTSMLRAGLQRNMTIDQILQRGTRQRAPTGQMPTQGSPTQQG